VAGIDLDLMSGLRFAIIRANANYNLAIARTGLGGNGAVFGGTGSVSANPSSWNGIARFRGASACPSLVYSSHITSKSAQAAPG
jgi:hypothetical protein